MHRAWRPHHHIVGAETTFEETRHIELPALHMAHHFGAFAQLDGVGGDIALNRALDQQGALPRNMAFHVESDADHHHVVLGG